MSRPKVSRIALIFGLLMPSAWPSTAPSQVTSRAAPPRDAPVQMPPKIAKPTKFFADPEAPGQLWKIWLAADGYQPRALPGPDAPGAFGSKKLGFMESCSIAYDYQAADRDYLLVGRPGADGADLDLIGWVPKDYAVLRQNADKDPATNIIKKAMIINRPEDLKDDRGQFRSEAVVVGGPWPGAAERTKYSLFNVFFVFATAAAPTPTPAAATAAGGGDGGYVLVGTSPYFSDSPREPELAPEKVIQGWVPSKQVLPWSKREAVEWDRPSTLPGAPSPRQSPAVVDRSVQEAYARFYPDVLTRAKVAPPAEFDPIMQEAFVKDPKTGLSTSMGFKPHEMRFPLLDWKGNDRFPSLDPITGKNSLYRVGGMGGFGGLSKQDVDALRQRLDEIARRLEAVEVLFVIDDTGSMGRYFPAVADAVEAMEEDARRLSGRSTRVAVAFFNDTDGKPDNWSPVTPMDLKSAAEFGGGVAQKVREHPAISGGDPREMVFRGLAEATEKAGFSTSALKQVILIGDMGDKSDENDPAPARKLAEALWLGAKGEVELTAIQVVPANLTDESRAFKAQVEAVIGALSERAGSGRRLGRYVPLASVDLGTLLGESYARLRSDSDRIRGEIDALRRGEFHTVISDETRRKLERQGIDLEELKKSAKDKAQLFGEGFVWKYARGAEGKAQQVRVSAMLSRKEIEDLLRFLRPLVGELGTTTVQQAIRKVIRDMTGESEVDDNISFQDVLKKRLGLEAQTPLLRTKLRAVGNRLERQQLEDVANRLDRLQDVLQGVQRTWKTDTRVDPATKESRKSYIGSKEVSKLDRHFTLPGNSTEWYWIDVETELP